MSIRWSLFLLLIVVIQGVAYSQIPVDSLKADSLRVKSLKAQNRADNTSKQYDFSDLTRNILHPQEKARSFT